MLFPNLKSLALYALLAVASATPLFTLPQDGNPHTSAPALEARMTKKKGASHSYKSLQGHVISQEAISKALGEVRRHRAADTKVGKYPEKFANQAKNNGLHSEVFAGRGTGPGARLLEWPMLQPGEKFPGSVRLVVTDGATPNFVGLMQHPAGLSSSFKKLEPVKDECSAGGASSKDAAKKHTARSLWDLVRRKVTGKKGKSAQGAACAYKPKGKPKGKSKGKTPAKKPGKATHRKKKAAGTHKKKTAKTAHKKRPAKKRPAKKRPARKRPARKHARPTRKGGRRGGRRGGRV